MKIPIFILVISSTIFFIGTVFANDSVCSASLPCSSDETIICEHVYYFLVKNLDFRGVFNYTSEDIVNLTKEINKITQDSITNEYITNKVHNFSLCSATNLTIPQARYKAGNLSLVKLSSNFFNCSTSLNKTIAGFDLDTSVPIFSYYLDQGTACSSIEHLNYVFKVDEESGRYAIKGIRVIFIFIPVLILITIQLVQSNTMLKRAVKRFNTKIQ